MAFFLPDLKTPRGVVMRVAENQYPHNLHPNPGHESSRATVLNSDPNNTIHGPKLSRLTRITVLVQLLNRPWTKFGEPRLRIHPKRYNPKVLLRHSWIPSTSDSEFFRCGRASIAQHSIQYTLGESYHQTSTLKVFTHSPTLMTLQIVGMYLQRSSCNTFSA